ncbi:MAG: 4-(cytidine 5'-diphospho)-2-C-methyl-D-erythritol kinase [Gammaproteobacteria bacterium]|nr:4-(cytidine 5'-diphospho)-2-C-methyl-D-erythritol kinase [Gammaproteobacteria bacterium]
MALTQLTLPAPAKLNLFLRITGRRADGYHQLQTLFQLLEFGDSIHLQLLSDNTLQLSKTMPGVAAEDNLALKAARLLQQYAWPQLSEAPGARISVEKRLPMGGGLGGGSSDAASVLLGLNRLWGLGLGNEKLAALGLELGADVPVFIYGQNSIGEGIGERLRPLHTGPAWFVVLAPRVNISTASIFSQPQMTRDSHAIRIPADCGSASAPVPLHDWPQGSGLPAGELRNDCEAVVRSLYPEVDTAISQLGRFGNARLTGTGGCVFASFADCASARRALQAMPSGLDGFISEASERSTAKRALEQLA